VIDKVIMVSLASLIVVTVINTYLHLFSEEAMNRRVEELYADIWRQTGQSQERLPLYIVDSDEINAYNDGTKIIIYTGLIKSTNSWDELALVIGHEIAHGNLWHLRMLREDDMIKSDVEVSVMEANADKMGAVYMMKAGYDVCKGREIFKAWLDDSGDYLGGTHPGYAYRYSQLNINCE